MTSTASHFGFHPHRRQETIAPMAGGVSSLQSSSSPHCGHRGQPSGRNCEYVPSELGSTFTSFLIRLSNWPNPLGFWASMLILVKDSPLIRNSGLIRFGPSARIHLVGPTLADEGFIFWRHKNDSGPALYVHHASKKQFPNFHSDRPASTADAAESGSRHFGFTECRKRRLPQTHTVDVLTSLGVSAKMSASTSRTHFATAPLSQSMTWQSDQLMIGP